MRLAASAYLGRYTGTSRTHAESNLRLFFAECADQHLAPLAAQRADRAVCAVHAGNPPVQTLYCVPAYGRGYRVLRICVIDGVLEHSPADYVAVPGPSRVTHLGLSRLQFEALLTAARESPNVLNFALVTMLGLLGLRSVRRGHCKRG